MSRVSITIHRSAHEIGGNCIEIATRDGHRLLLDAGRPLDTPEGQPTPLPATLDVSGKPDAVLLSHLHQDHVGMLRELPAGWPVWCGSDTGRLMNLLGSVLGQPVPQRLMHWSGGREFSVGPFHVTPLLTDHSAFDAYMLLIRVNERAILYTGDFRDHGRKGKLIPAILNQLPQLDAMIIEGTNLGSGKSVRSESTLEQDFIQCFSEARGRVFLSWSAMNIDRTVSIFKACRKARRTLVVDLYTAQVLRAVRNPRRKIPQPDWPGVKVVVTAPLATRFTQLGWKLLDELKDERVAIPARYLKHSPERWVVMTRGSLVRDYQYSGLVPENDDAWVWSQWSGYLEGKDGIRQKEYFGRIAPQLIHTSGHASERCLTRFAEAAAARQVIPVHGEKWDLASHGVANIVRLGDGEVLAI